MKYVQFQLRCFALSVAPYLCGALVLAACAQPLAPSPKSDKSAAVAAPAPKVAEIPETPQGGSDAKAAEPTPQGAPLGEECVPQCRNRECGSDGCGKQCGGCKVGSACEEQTGRCFECPKGECICAPKCDRRVCGDDSCGGTCGDCVAGTLCDDKSGQCRPTQCGNRMVEPGEECDGDEFCTDGCKRLTPKQSACLVAAAAGASDVCRKCICLECTEPVNGCYLSEDAVRNANCKSIIDCGRNSNCTGVNCYCGDPSCSRANGPCTSVIEEAIGTRNPLQIAACFTDPDCVGGRSKQLSDCISFNCKEACADDFVTAAPAAM